MNTSKTNIAAVSSYITIVGCVIALFMNLEEKNPITSFHIRQSFGLSVLFILIGIIIGNFDSWMVSGSFYLFFVSLWTYGFIGALQGEMREIPLLGSFFQKLFKSLS